MKRLVAIGSIGLLSLSALAACGDDDQEESALDVQEANATFCNELTAYADAVRYAAALDPETATKADYTSAASAVRSTREALISSGEDLSEAEWTNLQLQAATLADQLQDAPDDATVSSILTDAKPQAAKVEASAATLNTAVCTSGAPTSTG